MYLLRKRQDGWEGVVTKLDKDGHPSTRTQNSDWSRFRGILELSLEDLQDNNNVCNENIGLFKEVILLGWQKSREKQSCHL